MWCFRLSIIEIIVWLWYWTKVFQFSSQPLSTSNWCTPISLSSQLFSSLFHSRSPVIPPRLGFIAVSSITWTLILKYSIILIFLEFLQIRLSIFRIFIQVILNINFYLIPLVRESNRLFSLSCCLG